MLVIMRKGYTMEEGNRVEEAITRMGYKALRVPGADRTAICITGNKDPVEPAALSGLPGVLEVIQVTRPYKLVSREVQPDDTIVKVGTAAIGGPEPVVIAGPCSVETEARTLAVAVAARKAGATLFRAGAFKPRTSPYTFQGLGHEALATLRRVREETGLPIVSEVIDLESIPMMLEHVDVLQVGARNMANFSLLKKLGEIRKPVLLKRGMSASLEEWLMAAEYLLLGGNREVILCERGIRTFCRYTRNTLDLNVVPHIREISHLPILVDPSHGTGRRELVRPMARGALACGAHGLLVEAHVTPASSYTDAGQTIDMKTLAGIVEDARSIGSVCAGS